MINEFTRQVLLPRLANTGYYGVLTGVVKTLTMIDNGKAQTFPITCNTNSKDVYNSGEHRRFMPDSNKQSIGFFEAGDYRFERGAHNRERRAIFLLKFCAWYNLDRMGVQGCDAPFAVVNATVEALETVTANTPFDSVAATVSVTRIYENNPRSVFGRYSFVAEDGYFLAPYAFAGFDLQVVATFKPSCIPALPEAANCDCQIF